MKKLILHLMIPFFLFASTAQSHTLTDYQGEPEQWGVSVPGISCKTRTNNDASVRNLAMGVLNQDATKVALNCGFAVPLPAAGVNMGFTGNANVKGFMNVIFVRTAGTPTSSANNSFCSIFAADTLSPNSPALVDGTSIGMAQANFNGATGVNEVDSITLDSAGDTYPSNTVMFTAFCEIYKGVRMQAIVFRPDLDQTH